MISFTSSRPSLWVIAQYQTTKPRNREDTQMRKYWIPSTLVVVLISAVVALAFTRSTREARQEADDRQEVINQLHRIFQAFVEQDKETLRATHADNWMGFKASSLTTVKGIEGYMQDITFGNPMLEYEIEEVQVQLLGDIAVVYYVARWKNQIKQINKVVTMHARSVDIYGKHAQKGWIQVGSNLNILPRAGSIRNPACGRCFDVAVEE